ncbi:MAG: ATP-binding cassette domain-containing protein [Acidimicrobiia bacterium]|nr:MAG: ATP-binding cassette domain-containing protein [Acidimicrobiia bacterium]
MTGIAIAGIDLDLGPLHLVIDELTVGSGETLVLFGPNGAGKTTLLRCIAGLAPGCAGVEAAYLPQRPWVLRGPARRTLHLGSGPAGIERAEALAASMGLGGRLEGPGRALSGGERQRLALAAVLARSEPVVLLDEPLGALDAADRPSVAAIVRDALRDRSAVVVTHDRDEAVMLGDEMAVLIGGRIRQRGPAAEVVSLPADEGVAGVLGVANAVVGEVVEAAPGLAAVVAGSGVLVWGLGDATVGAPGTALFGAETVTVFRGGDAASGSARNHWTGRVVALRQVGRLVEVVAEVGVTVAALLTPGSVEAMRLEVGEVVTLSVKATAVRVVPR